MPAPNLGVPPPLVLKPGRRALPVFDSHARCFSHAIVSEQDFDRLSRFRWLRRGLCVGRLDGRKMIRLNHEVTGSCRNPAQGKPPRVRHANADPFDFTRENLQVVNPSSVYRGVTKHGDAYRASLRHDGKDHHLGQYRNEHEAGFAYNTGVLLSGRRQTGPNKIDEASLPTPERQVKIREEVAARLAGPFARPGKDAAAQQRKWKGRHYEDAKGFCAYIKCSSRSIYLGCYPMSAQAVVAFSHAESLVNGEGARQNPIQQEDPLCEADRTLIRRRVETTLKLRGLLECPVEEKPHLATRAPKIAMILRGEYFGVSYHRPSRSWQSGIRHNEEGVHLAYHRDRHQAAYAVNHAETLLHKEAPVLNRIQQENEPDENAKAAIRSKVECRLRKKALI